MSSHLYIIKRQENGVLKNRRYKFSIVRKIKKTALAKGVAFFNGKIFICRKINLFMDKTKKFRERILFWHAFCSI